MHKITSKITVYPRLAKWSLYVMNNSQSNFKSVAFIYFMFPIKPIRE